MDSSCSPRTVLGLLLYTLCYNDALMCIRPERAMNFGFHEVEPMLASGCEQ